MLRVKPGAAARALSRRLSLCFCPRPPHWTDQFAKIGRMLLRRVDLARLHLDIVENCGNAAIVRGGTLSVEEEI